MIERLPLQPLHKNLTDEELTNAVSVLLNMYDNHGNHFQKRPGLSLLLMEDPVIPEEPPVEPPPPEEPPPEEPPPEEPPPEEPDEVIYALGLQTLGDDFTPITYVVTEPTVESAGTELNNTRTLTENDIEVPYDNLAISTASPANRLNEMKLAATDRLGFYRALTTVIGTDYSIKVKGTRNSYFDTGDVPDFNLVVANSISRTAGTLLENSLISGVETTHTFTATSTTTYLMFAFGTSVSTLAGIAGSNFHYETISVTAVV